LADGCDGCTQNICLKDKLLASAALMDLDASQTCLSLQEDQHAPRYSSTKWLFPEDMLHDKRYGACQQAVQPHLAIDDQWST